MEMQKFTILLVEDEMADAYLVQAALKENQILADLHHVIDGREALEYLHRQGEKFANAVRPNLILLDLNMPRMNGREFLDAIKREPELRDIPVVVLTTSEVERDVVSSYDLGAAGYISKPIDVGDFMGAIRDLSDYWVDLVRLPASHGR